MLVARLLVADTIFSVPVQAKKDTPLEVPAVERSSKILFVSSAAVTALAAVISI